MIVWRARVSERRREDTDTRNVNDTSVAPLLSLSLSPFFPVSLFRIKLPPLETALTSRYRAIPPSSGFHCEIFAETDARTNRRTGGDFSLERASERAGGRVPFPFESARNGMVQQGWGEGGTRGYRTVPASVCERKIRREGRGRDPRYGARGPRRENCQPRFPPARIEPRCATV